MTTIITDFHELGKPHSDADDGNEDWCTCDKDKDGLYYLLNDGSYTLGDLMDGLKRKEFHFDTAGECHAHACMHYKQHGEYYPYVAEWIAADPNAVINIVPDTDTTESQVMEFI